MADARAVANVRSESPTRSRALPPPDASVLLDNRAAKKLDPVRLPSKLRERVEKAQRRAVAAKDGVSIFTSANALSSSASTGNLGHRLSEGSIQRSASMLDVPAHLQPGSLTQPLGSVDDPESGGTAGGKTHLPQVVLRHKMREFEAKMNASGALADPLDAGGGGLSRLSIEDKERVMARMQDKIRAITDEVEAGFARIRREMDAHGVFDEAANYQRAQAVCLVELQRRCRLDKVRDEAVDEVLGVKKSVGGGRKVSNGFLGSIATDGKAAAVSTKPMDKSLRSLLRSPDHAGTRSPSHLETRRATRTASRAQKRASVLPKLDNDVRRSATAPARALSPSREAAASISPGSRHGKRGGGDPGETDPLHTAEMPAGSADEVWTRHPHVLHAIQALNSGKEPAKGGANGSARGAGDLEAESDRRLSPADEWQERSASYRAIAERTCAELWRRADRLRWDSTGHFTAAECSLGVYTPTEELRRRLETQQQGLLRLYGAASSEQEDAEEEERERERAAAADESLAVRRERSDSAYALLQAQIVDRLAKWSRQRAPNASVARRKQRQQLVSIHGREDSLGPDTPPLTSTGAPMSAMETPKSPKSATRSRPASTAGLLSTGEAAIESVEQPTEASELHETASMPVLAATAVPVSASRSPSASLVLGNRLGTRHRLSLLERRLLASQQSADGQALSHERGSLRPSRRGFHRDSRIGAPPPVPSFASFGRHSEARIAERRYSAQTWAWHAADEGVVDASNALEEGESDEEDDEFDDALLLEEGGEEGEDEGEDAEDAEDGSEPLRRPRLRAIKSGLSSLAADSDDTRSMASYAPPSARSMASVATSVLSAAGKQAAVNNASCRPRASKRRVSSPGRHAALCGDALSLHGRLEAVWKALEFPFSHKLLMAEQFAELVEDSGALERALEPWEACVRAVLVRERMKSALARFADRQELKDGSRLGPDDVAALAAETGSEALDADKAAGYARVGDPQVVAALSAEGYIKWVNDHIGGATAWCLRAARALRDATGHELEFQGASYPPRSVSGLVKDV